MPHVEQGPGDELPGLITAGNAELSLPPDDPVRALRHEYAESFRRKLLNGEVSNGIRPLAIFAAKCKEDGVPVTDLTIGSIDWRYAPNPGRLRLADDLGLYPLGAVHRNIESFADTYLMVHMDRGKPSMWSYQPEATGLPELRAEFVRFVGGFGLPYRTEETFLAPGSLPGLDNVIGAIRYYSHLNQQSTDFLFPVPGFSVIRAQAVRRLIPVTVSPHPKRRDSASLRKRSRKFSERRQPT